MAVTEPVHNNETGRPAEGLTVQDAAEALRRGHQARILTHDESAADEKQGTSHSTEGETTSEGPQRARKTRGGTHEQHTAAGKKGGSRIRQLIELGYKYEQEHGIGPGRSERSKLAPKRRAKSSGEESVG